VTTQSEEKTSRYQFVFFVVLFIACVLGSISVFIFPMSLIKGNHLIHITKKDFIENLGGVVLLFGVFNVIVFCIYLMNKKKG